MNSVFITGGSGFLARYIIESFVDFGITCFVFRRNSLPFSISNHPKIISVFSFDPTFFQLNKISIDAFLHIGGPAAQFCSASLTQQCLVQANHIVNFITTLKIPQLVYFSSIHVYGSAVDTFSEVSSPNPCSTYGIMKHILEDFFMSSSEKLSFDFVSLRLSNVIAPPFTGFSNWHLVFHSFLHSCYYNRAIIIKSNPLLTRDFITIDYLLNYLYLILQDMSPPSFINLSSGLSLSLLDLANHIRDRYCFNMGLDVSNVDIVYSVEPYSLPSAYFGNQRLISLYGAFVNDITLQIDSSINYLSSL